MSLQKDVEVLTPNTSECSLIWKQGLHRYSQDEVIRLMQKGKSECRHAHRRLCKEIQREHHVKMKTRDWSDTSTRKGTQQDCQKTTRNRPETDFSSQPSEGTNFADTLILGF